jgi:hypothetical protein
LGKPFLLINRMNLARKRSAWGILFIETRFIARIWLDESGWSRNWWLFGKYAPVEGFSAFRKGRGSGLNWHDSGTRFEVGNRNGSQSGVRSRKYETRGSRRKPLVA